MPNAVRKLPDQETLQLILDYDAVSGALTWKPRGVELFKTAGACKSWNTRFAGKPALNVRTKTSGLSGTLLGCGSVLAHRVIWKWMTGEDPDVVDHFNGNNEDNRWSNIRDATRSLNQRNRKVSSRSSTGVTGVVRHKASGKWRAQIVLEGKPKHLGLFDDFELAVEARRTAEKENQFHQRKSA